jgi:PBSX family phage terminase large subunit
MVDFSTKQADFIRMFKRGELSRINILEGSVRSGKTWITLVVWALWVATMPKDAQYLMVAKTMTSLKRNCLDLLQSLVGEKNFKYNTSSKEAILFGRTVYLEGVNDARAESKIRGMTLQGAYCDELTLFQEDFFAMLLSRLSMPGAKLFGSTNPDTPSHWLNVKYLKRGNELDVYQKKFLIDDNPYLDAEYIANLKKEYTGVFYKRFILGEWVVADGLCYQQFANTPEKWLKDEPDEDMQFISVGVDFGGNRSLTTFVATAFYPGFSKIGILKDYHITGRKGDIDGDRLNREFIRFVKELQAEYKAPVRYCFADSAEQYLIAGLMRATKEAGLQISIGDSTKSEIVTRIICMNTLLNTNRVFFLRRCSLVIDGMRSAAWDAKAAEKGQDKRLDDFSSDIDIIDATEYSFSRFIPKLTPRI